MIRWKSENVLWYILIVTIIQNGDTTKIRQIGKTLQKNQQSSEQNYFEMSDCHNRKLDLNYTLCQKNTTTTNPCTTTTTSCATTTTKSCATTTTKSCETTTPNLCTTTVSDCVQTKKTTTCNPDKQDGDDDDDDEDENEGEGEVKLSSYKPDWPKCSTTTMNNPMKNCKHNNINTPPSTTKCSTEMITTVENCVETTKCTTRSCEIDHKLARPFKMKKFPMLNVYEATLPPFLEHYITFGTFKRIICPLLKNTHTKYINNNKNTSDTQQIASKYKKKLISLNNFRKNLLFSETLQQNVENKSDTTNKNNWLHFLQERLQKGNSEYEDDKPTMKTPIMNLKQKWKNEELKPTNHEDFMQYFLRNNLYNKNNQNLQTNNIHVYHSKNPDNSFEFNKFNLINNHQKSTKRNAYNKVNKYEGTPLPPTNEEENNKSKFYDKDIETKKMAKLDNIFGNIIKDITENNENDLIKSNNDSIKNNDQQNDEDISLFYTITTEQPLMNSYKPSNNEPNIQILNITQVFNMYSKLIPFKKYIEALHSNKVLATSEIEKTKNDFDNESDNSSWYNQSNENDLKQRIQYALIKELLKNFIKNSTEIDQMNYNDNFYDSNALSSSLNKNFNFNPFSLALPKKSKKAISSNNKVKVPKIKRTNNDNDRIVNAIKDIIFKSIANNDENDDLLNSKKLKWNPSYETINQYA
uniref:Putative secreted protein n=1 Tax=Panstrongylus lignarius TaxID=156445 RepID=A0A224XJL7_9HEMI